MKHPFLHINLNLSSSGFDVYKGRAYCGKILEQLASFERGNLFYYLVRMKPLIIVEEADILAPNLGGGVIEPSSLFWLRYYVIKLQKYHVELFFITQDPSLIDSVILSNFHNQFLGVIESRYSQYAELTRSLKWDINTNYREFRWVQKGRHRDIIFSPIDSPCLLP